MIERVDVVQRRRSAAFERVALIAAAAKLPTAAGARHGGGDECQTTTKVGADVVVDERIGARVAVGETVAEDAKHGVGPVTRL